MKARMSGAVPGVLWALLAGGLALVVALGAGPALSAEGGIPQGPPALGADGAPITIIEFGDFFCAFCALFATEIKPRIHEAYIATGKVRFEWRHFALLGLPSLDAARGGVCAHAAGRFWPYHDYFYENQQELEGRGLEREDLLEIAARLGMDADAFAACLADGATQAVVAGDFRLARAIGAVVTPTFLVNGNIRISGAQPFEFWARLLDQLLERLEAD